MTTETMTVTYRDLENQECKELIPALEQAGFSLPYPETSVPIVAEVDGRIVGFGIAQLVPHAEPIHVLPEWRGAGIAEELSRRVIAKLVESGHDKFCALATNAFAEKLCEANGMVEVKGKLYVKR